MQEFADIETTDGTRVPIVPIDSDIGGTGSVLQAGKFTEEEFNKALRPFKARGSQGNHGIFDKMRRTDATVNGVLLSQELPIRAAEWIVEPPENPTDQERRISDLVADNLFHRLEGGWDGFIAQAMLFLQFGFMLFERVYERTPRGYHRLRKLAPRMPWSVWRWVEDDSGNLVAVTQRVKKGMTGWENIVIPSSKTLLLINRLEGGNWEGISAIRQAYGPWLKKDEIDRRDLINYERFGSGLPVFEEPPNFNPSDPQWKADLDRVDEIGRNLRAHQKSYVQVPRGWTFDVKFPQGGGLPVGQKQKYYDHQILLNSLAMLMDLGNTETGSRALGETFSDLFLHALRGHARVVEDALNGVNGLSFTGVIPEMVALNFGPQERYPKIRATKLSSKAVELKGISDAVDKGLLRWGDRDEELLRDWLDMPSTPHEIESSRVGLPAAPLNSDPSSSGSFRSKELSREEAREAQRKRSERYGIAVLPTTHVTKPGRWESLPDSEFGDPVNYRYPMPDKAHIRNARSRIAQESESYRGKKVVEERIEDAARKAKIGEFSTKAKESFTDIDGRSFTAWRSPTGSEMVVSWASIQDDMDEARYGLGKYAAPVSKKIVERYKEEADPIIAAIQRGEDIEENTTRLTNLEPEGAEEMGKAIEEHMSDVARSARVHLWRELGRQEFDESKKASEPLKMQSVPEASADVGAIVASLVALNEILPFGTKVEIFMRAQETIAQRKLMSHLRGVLSDLAVQDALTGSTFLEEYVAPEATGTTFSKVAGGYAQPLFNEARESATKSWEGAGGKPVEKVRFTALADSATCEPCNLEDGSRYVVGSGDYQTNKPPFHRCKGWSSCRCMYIYEIATGAQATGQAVWE